MGVIIVAAGRDFEVVNDLAAELLTPMAGRTARDAADPEAAALDPQLMDALVLGAQLANIPLGHHR
jgi:hypothetical protein